MGLLWKRKSRVAVAVEQMSPTFLAVGITMAVSVSVWTIVATQVVQVVAQLRVVILTVAVVLHPAIVAHIVGIKIAMNICAVVAVLFPTKCKGAAASIH